MRNLLLSFALLLPIAAHAQSVSAAGSITAQGAITGHSTLAITGNTALGGTLGVAGLATFSGGISGSAVNATTLAISGNATIAGTLGVLGSSVAFNVGQSTPQISFSWVPFYSAAQFNADLISPQHTTWSGGNFPPFIYYNNALSGTKTGGAGALASIGTSSDTMAAGGGGLTGLGITMNGGGSSSTGNRIGEYITLNYSGGPTNKSVSAGNMFSNLFAYATVSGNVGGTTGAGNAWGSLWGGVISANLASGGTYFQGISGLEVDVGVSTGASSSITTGINLVLSHHQQAVGASDGMLTMVAQSDSSVGLSHGILFGNSTGIWPISSSGTLIGTSPPLAGSGSVYAAAYGVDFRAVTFSSNAFASTGFGVDGTGAAIFGSPTGATGARMSAKQSENGKDILFGQRFTDVSPTGTFLRLANAAGSANLFYVDVSGNVNATTFISSTSNAIILTSQSSGAASGSGTLTNAPSAGNPNFWLPVTINGTTRYIPAW